MEKWHRWSYFAKKRDAKICALQSTSSTWTRILTHCLCANAAIPTSCRPHGATGRSTNVKVETAPGGCLCGAVRFTVTGPLREIVFCHCRQCRRQQGRFAAYTAAPREAIALEDDRGPVWFASSESVRHEFCQRCGSSLFWDRLSWDLLCVAAGALDDAALRRPGCHIHVDSKADYYDIDDGLDRYPGSRCR